MLDLKFIRENTSLVKKGIKNKSEAAEIDKIIALDKERRQLLQAVEKMKHERNIFSNDVSKLKKEKEDASAVIEKTREISQNIKAHDEKLKEIEDTLSYELDRVPNMPHESVPVGKGPSQNVVIRAWGKMAEFDFKISNHIDIAERLDILDFPAGSKISGSGFPVYKGQGAKLERALINFMLDVQTSQHGYKEIFPPFVVNRDSMRGTGQLPKLEEDMYHCEKDDLFLIPTAEVPLTNLLRDEILKAEGLPIKYCAYSACFRREAGSRRVIRRIRISAE
jgi:seryl-tRNA synthetase